MVHEQSYDIDGLDVLVTPYTVRLFEDGDLLVALAKRDLSKTESVLKMIVDAYKIGQMDGEKLGAWKARRAVRAALGVDEEIESHERRLHGDA